MKKIIIVAAVCFAVLLAFLPSLGKMAVNTFLIKETAVDVSQRETDSHTVNLQKGDYVVFGEYLDEPILWQVLNVKDGRALLMTKYIICLKAFDESKHHDGEDRVKYGSNEWSKSTLNQWLNSSEQAVMYNAYSGESGFLHDNNFSSKQRDMISEDGIFILSRQELSKLTTETQRRKTCTASALRDNESPYLITSSKSVWYWTSSKSSSNRVSVTVVNNGGGYYKTLACDGVTGVAPSLYIESFAINTNGGDGSKENPYFICR